MSTKRKMPAGIFHDERTGKYGFVTDGPPRADGKRQQIKRRGYRTIAEAVEERDRHRVKVADGAYIRPEKVTLGEYLERWLTTIKVEPSTLASYSRNMKLHVIDALGGYKLATIDSPMIRAHLRRLGESGRRDGRTGGLSRRTVEYVATVLRGALQDAVEERLIAHNPAAFGRRDRGERRTKKARQRADMHTWTAEQLRQFLDLEKDTRYGPAFAFLALTGCRRGEALGVRWSDIDPDAARCTFRQTVTAIDHVIQIQERGGTKTGVEREIELDADTVAILRTWRAKQNVERLAMGAGYAPGDFVFGYPDGRPYDPDRFSREFNRRVERHGMPRIRLHDLRHSWATLALEAGVDMNVVKDRLGHSSIVVTADIYAHVTRKVQSGAAEKVAGLVFGGAS